MKQLFLFFIFVLFFCMPVKISAQESAIQDTIVDLQEVVIAGRNPKENVSMVQTGVEKISMKEINRLPVLMGERDLLKSIQLLPGVRSAGEGNGGMFVRGIVRFAGFHIYKKVFQY
ncbi:MAG: hypothetical protein EZS26_002637 [Candidatus Ordinivivax streblomastigis]|uniref:TonB-dependent receptor plug domain-containing protein n=1 Tax=Candidatus Ordinivivax streblomastigis TaxID=2540710 RepID=A0A5M8NWU1_9BACT|nr:MAG: hypothetical protein EZS26_002637 [Candidatus Ordinivivax streblomastigis]